MATGYESDVLLHKACLWLRDSCVSRFVTSVPNQRFGGCTKEGLSIICPTLSYDNAQASLVLELLVVYCQSLCQSLFDNILDCRDHRLHHFCQDFDVKFKLKGPGIVLVSIAVA